MNDQSALALLFEDEQCQLTGVAVFKTGRIFTSYPLWHGPYKYSLVEIIDGKPNPYPNEEMNSWKECDVHSPLSIAHY